jgi:anti-sigma B factor antagonist
MADTVVAREDKKAVVSPASDIVAGAAPQLRAALRELLEQGVCDIVMDLTNVRMVDSTGLGLLVSTYNSLRKINGQFSVIAVSPEILKFFQTMRLSQHFSISPAAVDHEQPELR